MCCSCDDSYAFFMRASVPFQRFTRRNRKQIEQKGQGLEPTGLQLESVVYIGPLVYFYLLIV